MASTAEMLHMIRHAADQLEGQDSAVFDAFGAKLEAAQRIGDHEGQNRAMWKLAHYVAASQLAITTLRMVAVCMDDEPESKPANLERGPDGRFRKAGA